MHQKSIGHLGLTPLDIMFSRPGGSEIKMCDFSLSKRIVGIVKMDHGQPEFVAPEIVNGEGATFASDMWATGIITYLLLSGVSPFRGQVRRIYIWLKVLNDRTYLLPTYIYLYRYTYIFIWSLRKKNI